MVAQRNRLDDPDQVDTEKLASGPTSYALKASYL